MDLLKYIAMFYVVITHVVQRVISGGASTLFFNILYTAHMPLFMFVSGYFIKRSDKFYDLIKYIFKMFMYYIVPSIVFTLITVISLPRYNNHDVLYWFKEFFLRTDSFYWYGIVALIINSLLAISYFISIKILKIKDFKSNLYQVLITLGIMGVLMLPIIFVQQSEYKAVLSINLLVRYIPLVILGYLFKEFGKYIKTDNKLLIFESIAIIPLFIVYYYILNKYRVIYEYSDVKMLIHMQIMELCIVFIYYVLSKWLCKLTFFKDLSKYGKYSYALYLVHVYIIRLITPFVSKVPDLSFNSISFIICYTLIFAIGSLFITIWLTKNRYINLLLFGDYKPFISKKLQKNN